MELREIICELFRLNNKQGILSVHRDNKGELLKILQCFYYKI
jgi:hypothetical protein